MNRLFTFCTVYLFLCGNIYAQAPTDPILKENTQYITSNLSGILTTPESQWDASATTGIPDEYEFGEFKAMKAGEYQFIKYEGYPDDYFAGFWCGFTCSNVTDKETGGLENQYAAITGAGKKGAEYAIAYDGTGMMGPEYAVTLKFSDGKAHQMKGMYVTNSTYAFYSMKNGDGYAKAFTTTDKDWFKLTAIGYDEKDTKLGELSFYLADFRTGTGYIINDWRWFELSPLGHVNRIEFRLTSSDTGASGINTPAYFCADGITAVSNEDDSQHGPRLNTMDIADVYMPAGSYYNPDVSKATADPFGDVSTSFNFNEFNFKNLKNQEYGSWSGFVYSNVNDRETPGFINQNAAITGGGVSKEGSLYTVGYYSSYGEKRPILSFADGLAHTLAGTYVTNSTYAYLSMLNGDSYSKKFGGTDGNDPDWFKLTAIGYNNSNIETGRTDCYLADFRGQDKYISNTWKWMDLSSLGSVTRIEFILSSSDNTGVYMNTPAYFCLDGAASIIEDYPLPQYGSFEEQEGVEYDQLNMNGKLTSPETSWIGEAIGEPDLNGYYKNEIKEGPFQLSNYFSPWGFGGGFAYTNTTDTTTSNYTNLSAIAGEGKAADTYLTANSNSFTPAEIKFAGNTDRIVHGMYVTNSTYAYLTIKNGNEYAKKFGGKENRDGDWFKLKAIGYDNNDRQTGETEIYLADYRFLDSTKDFTLNDWTWFDLTPLGEVSSITFEMSSSDNGQFGMNTPSYFSIDQVVSDHVVISSMKAETASGSLAYCADNVLYLKGLNGYSITVTDMRGTPVYQTIANSELFKTYFGATSGIYLVRAEKDGLSVSFKIVVK